MVGRFGQIARLLKDAGRIKESAQQINARLEAARYVGEAGGGQVKATVDGRSELVAIKIDPALVQTGDVELIEDLVVAAARVAARQCREAMQKDLESLTGGLSLQGLLDILGGRP